MAHMQCSVITSLRRLCSPCRPHDVRRGSLRRLHVSSLYSWMENDCVFPRSIFADTIEVTVCTTLGFVVSSHCISRALRCPRLASENRSFESPVNKCSLFSQMQRISMMQLHAQCAPFRPSFSATVHFDWTWTWSCIIWVLTQWSWQRRMAPCSI